MKQKANINKKKKYFYLSVIFLFFLVSLTTVPAIAQSAANANPGKTETGEPAVAIATDEPGPGTDAQPAPDQESETPSLSDTERQKIEKFIKDQVSWGKIPGLFVVIVKNNQTVYEQGFGFADVENQTPITPGTLFELGSCSKAFTGLAILQLEAQGVIDLNDPVEKYLPWLKLNYKGQAVPVTIAQFLHQSSGVPFESIGAIPPNAKGEKALEETVRTLVGTELVRQPGQAFLYATINYDVLGLVIQQVSGLSFEEYIKRNILEPLEMKQTVLSRAKAQEQTPGLATGYRLCLKKPVPYEAPVYGGNVPAGYVISNGTDLAKWLKIQMGTVEPDNVQVNSAMIEKSHVSDPTLKDNSDYAVGWFHFKKHGLIAHGGNNPNFSSFIAFTTGENKIGTAVLANINSNFTTGIGQGIIAVLQGNEPRPSRPGLNMNIDYLGTMIVWVLVFFSIIALLLLVRAIIKISKEKRSFTLCPGKKGLLKLIFATLLVLAVVLLIFNLPALIGFKVPLSFALIWQPATFGDLIRMIFVVVALFYVFFLVRLFFPAKEK